MFASHGIRPWEIGQLEIEQVHQARHAFDEQIAEQQEAERTAGR